VADKIEDLDLSAKISKNKLLSVLKVEASAIDVQKIMRANSFLREDARYMQSPYREEYIERFSKAFFARIKDLKDDNRYYKGDVDVDKLHEFLEALKEQRAEAKSKGELCFLKIARIIALYTVFIREESIHPVGTKFPGGFKLRHVNGQYLCPVKEKQMKNPSALCRFCVSVQDETAG
jgi:uncharacterized protein (UPF0305 family)